MRKFKILEKMYVDGYDRSEWEEVGIPSDFTAEDTADAVDKYLDLCAEDFRCCENLHFRYVGDLCEVYYTDDEGRKVELDFVAKEIEA